MIAKEKKPHTIRETLVKPCALEMAKIVLGEDATKQFSQVSLSNDTVHQRIKDMSQDIITQVVSEIKQSPAKISMKTDESTDISNHSQLLVFVRYVHKNNIKEEFLFCEQLKTTTKALDVFKPIQSFFDRHELAWDLIGSICTDGAPTMIVKNIWIRCYGQQESSTCALYTLCSTSPSSVELRNEILEFLKHQQSPLADNFEDEHFIVSLGYLADIFSLLNDLNISIQGRNVDIVQSREKVVAFARKLPIWRIESGNLANFPILDNILIGDGKTLPVEILQEVKNHLEVLSTKFEGYFPDMDDLTMESVWIQNPFSFDISRLSNNDSAKDDFIDFQEDPKMNTNFKRAGMDVQQFWCEQIPAYASLEMRAMNVLAPFTTTYLCETGFSALLNLKSKWRNRLDVSDDIRVVLSVTVC
ncbi:protein ZBED8-like [Polypterus senegalus]|uniref:protein ZBED8-like n=1 Tax=Polypterus senegalus TaxID=55291 RepID=UPI001964ABB0|nr:protein ZBED8-like [Polypterus senegalus]